MKTCQERYGVDYPCFLPQARVASNDSSPNRKFAEMLTDNGVEFEREFPIGKFQYDFKVGNILLEINPSPTHNSTWGLFNKKGLIPTYHKNKSETAKENGFRCIHIWDWDNFEKIIKLLCSKNTIYARKCSVVEISLNDTERFLDTYHLQGYAPSKINIALESGGEIVSLMTFGEPRYNKNYESELIRYCSNSKVIGGAEKLFKYFVTKYSPKSIISYCDKSKFTGDVYERLGFCLLRDGMPSKHWYNIKNRTHITDNLLRQRGFDQLFGTSYGKGTSNEELMLQNGFVEIYDFCFREGDTLPYM